MCARVHVRVCACACARAHVRVHACVCALAAADVCLLGASVAPITKLGMCALRVCGCTPARMCMHTESALQMCMRALRVRCAHCALALPVHIARRGCVGSHFACSTGFECAMTASSDRRT